MNTPPATFTSVSVDSAAGAAPNANRMTSAFLNRLSLSAPRNCVQKKGAKRRVPRSWNWLTRVASRSRSAAGRPDEERQRRERADRDHHVAREGDGVERRSLRRESAV